MIRISSLCLLFALSTMAACAPDLGDAPFRCNEGEPACPDGYSCNAAGICVPEGECPAGVPGCEETLPSEAVCGDGQCHQQLGESCESCVKDCGLCPDRCGDGRCSVASGESCESCPADCGSCPPRCGDGHCDGPDGEDCANCADDCGACPIVCGDGRCDAGAESCADCAQDCGPCPLCSEGESQCVDTATQKTCSGGQWVTTSCESVCASTGGDYGACSSGRCQCGDYASFGEICNASTQCKPSLVCATYSGKSDGFCTRTCTDLGYACNGGTFSQWPECGPKTVGGANVCLFWCDDEWTCPYNMHCPNFFLGGYCEPNK